MTPNAAEEKGPDLPKLTAEGLVHAWPCGTDLWGNRGLNAQFLPGLTAVVGGDGAGKTTLLRLLAAEFKPHAGSLVWHVGCGNGGQTTEPIWPQPQAHRQRVFWCEPSSNRMDHLLGSEYLVHHRAQQPAWSTQVLQDLLEAADLTGHMHKPLFGLSAGMRRKLRLAAALASGAPLTLLDDPLAALDRPSAALVTEWLQDCAQVSHRVVVATCHEADTAELWKAQHLVSLDF